MTTVETNAASQNVTKDRSFARMFGVGKPRALPRASLAAFTTRDSMTVFTSFNLAPMAAEKLVEGGYLNQNTATTVAQLVCPVLVQVTSTIIIYNSTLYPQQVFVARRCIQKWCIMSVAVVVALGAVASNRA